MGTQHQIFKGTLLAVLAGILWGISGIFGQLFFETYHGNALWITSFRLIVAGIILLAMSYLKDRQSFFKLVKTKKNIPLLLLYTFGGVFSVQFFYYLTIQLSNSATATILQYTAPVFIMAFQALVQHQLPKLKSILFVLLAMLGVFLLITNGDFTHLVIKPLALLAGFITALAVVIYTISPKRLLDEYGALNVSGWGMLIAGIGSNIIYPLWRVDFKIEPLSIFYVLCIAIIGTAFAFLLWLQAVQYVSPLVVNVATATEPLSAVLLSIFLFAMPLTPLSVIAIILVIVSVILLSRTEQEI
ncbi:DMT family transporter [Lactococcus nasutitermitis]|uniref:DMT family transporter n=1 Tax=Lactococcus nasutitermitis TaxID=1652957 RepID=A0ABV9JCW2_9LACT|nr:DMT family transporter [Lactococcus nasutitermitis]